MDPMTRRAWMLGGTATALTAGSLGIAKPAAATLNAAHAGSLTIGGELHVHRLGFGALRILGPGLSGYPADPAEARRVLRRAVDLGVTLIDTADAYGPHVSERLIYDALYPYPRHLVIATKGGLIRPGTQPEDADGSPEHLREVCEGSLKRLHLERIDLYQLHIPDPKRPIEESIGALKQLRDEGKIRHIGVSNVTLEQLRRAQAVAPIVSVQNRYNVGYRESDEVLTYCEAQGLAFLPWGPLAGPLGPQASSSAATADRLSGIQQRYGINTQQAALAWLLARSRTMLPIPGTSNIEHLEQDIAAANVHLTAADMKAIG